MGSLDANNAMDNGFTHLSFFITYILRKYTIWFEENLLPNIFWENILFDLKKIYSPTYFEKIYCLILRKFLAQYILRKYTVWFEENFLPNIFWENILFDFEEKLLPNIFWEYILTLFDLKKITYQIKSLCFSKDVFRCIYIICG